MNQGVVLTGQSLCYLHEPRGTDNISTDQINKTLTEAEVTQYGNSLSIGDIHILLLCLLCCCSKD